MGIHDQSVHRALKLPSLSFNMRGSRTFCHWGPNLTSCYINILHVVDEGTEDPNTTISSQRNADDGSTVNAGFVAL